MTLPPVPQSGRSDPRMFADKEAQLLNTLEPRDASDLFATDPDPAVRRQGMLALRRHNVDDNFVLGDMCASRALTSGGALHVSYVGKALQAYRLAQKRADNRVDRLLARLALSEFVRWVVAVAEHTGTAQDAAVALWALAEAGTRILQVAATTRIALGAQAAGLAPARDASHEAVTGGGAEPTVAPDDDDPAPTLAADAMVNEQRTLYQDDPPSDATLGVDTVDAPHSPSASPASASLGEPHDMLSYATDHQLTRPDDGQNSPPLSDVPAPAPDVAHDRDTVLAAQSQAENNLTRLRRAVQPSAQPSDAFRVGDVIDGRFHVSEVKRGGMGVVYLCHDRDYNKDVVFGDAETPRAVALKGMRRDVATSDALATRFRQEAHTWIHLEKHRHIVRAYQVLSLDGNRPFIMLEMVSGVDGLGTDLKSWLDHRRVHLDNAMLFGLHVALGMQHAQRKLPGLVHRDLKPANILVTHEPVAKVTDFGLVRVLTDVTHAEHDSPAAPSERPTNDRLTRTGGIVGTPAYLSPEQCLPHEYTVDVRSDIYAFGLVLYEMLVGRHPFPNARNRQQWVTAHLNEQAVFDDDARHTLPQSVQDLVLACLAKPRDARPANWSVIVEALADAYANHVGEAPEMALDGPSLEARELMDMAYSLTELGHLDESLAVYDRALAHAAPKDIAWMWARKARTLRLAGRLHDALHHYDVALEYSPKYAWAWNGRGLVQEMLGDLEGALVCYQRAGSLDPDDVWHWYNHADVLQKLGRPHEALVLLSEGLTRDPAHAESMAKAGQVYRALGQHEDAVHAYAQATTLAPDFSWAWNGQGLALKALQRYEEALTCFVHASDHKPNDVWAWYNQAEVLLLLRRAEEALPPARRAAKLHPNSEVCAAKLGQVLRTLERYDEALEAYERALTLAPSYVWAWNGKGIVLERLGHYETALACYERATHLAPDDAYAWFNLGNTLARMGRPQDALHPLRQSVARNGHYIRAWTQLARVLLRLGQRDDAQATIVQATQQAPQNGLAWAERAVIHEALRQFREAYDAYSRAVALLPDSVSLRTQQASVAMSLQAYDDALRLLDSALVLNPAHPLALARRGHVLRRMGRTAEAVVAYDKTLALTGRDAWCWNGRGLALLAENRLDEARASFERAYALDGDDPWHAYNLADALLRLRQLPQAENTLRSALAHHPLHAQLWTKLGQLLRRLNEHQQAADAFLQAVSLQPDYAWAWHSLAQAQKRLQLFDQAATGYARAIALHPQQPIYHVGLIDLWLDARKLPDALAAADDAVAANPESADLWGRQGQVLRRVGRYDEAIASYERAVALEPRDGWAWNGLSLAHGALGDWDAALFASQQAVQYNAGDVLYWANLAEAYSNLGEQEAACAALGRALQLDPANNSVRALSRDLACHDMPAPPGGTAKP